MNPISPHLLRTALAGCAFAFFTPVFAQPAPATPAPNGPAPTVGMPGNLDCSKAENRKEPVCNKQADPGIERAPAANADPQIARTPPPTGDGSRAGPGAPPSRIGRAGNAPIDPGINAVPAPHKGS